MLGVSVSDVLAAVVRLSGLPELPRILLLHAMNVKAVVRSCAAELGHPLDAVSWEVAHLGVGISVALASVGRVVEVNNAAEGDPFGTRRAGILFSSSSPRAQTRPLSSAA